MNMGIGLLMISEEDRICQLRLAKQVHDETSEMSCTDIQFWSQKCAVMARHSQKYCRPEILATLACL